MASGKMAASKELMQMDLYGLLGIDAEASEKQIKKAYRQKALTCHPDKNPDNPRAAELFHQLSQALEVLTDGAARAAYDKLRKAKEAAAKRTQKLDEKRKKVKLDLEAREKEAQVTDEEEAYVARTFEQEIIRLREEGSRQLEEQQRLVREQIRLETLQKTQESAGPAKLKLKWKCKKDDERRGGYTEDVLQSLLQKYGEVLNIIVSSKKKGSAIVEFATFRAAELAVRNEAGLLNNPLQISWLDTPPPSAMPETVGKTASSGYSAQDPLRSERDYESLVLMRMRQAAERQRLIEQLQKEDEEANT
ncbi:dnaJ homolog subfamily C member 17 isoform X2 [Bufo gargarizans]|uniref:dnaJ homolog subfamily C member 17 isoform X2 n=1 Tax=Bufo gargarizans TaxID=30331 RepID=UPI001CF24D1A|nr:dnaJ homolog subfamily C member 17 isoform X2 [Bufo gargarizans]